MRKEKDDKRIAMSEARKEFLEEKLREVFGFTSFKEPQEEIIRSLLSGKDTFVLMPTGGGKSLCYQLPALVSPGVSVIVSPLIALMKNQVDAVRGISEKDGVAHFLNSSLSKAQLETVYNDVKSGLTKMLYLAPETLCKQDTADLLRELEVSFYAVDEAHCISEWGHDFRPEYRRLKEIIDDISRRPIIALTATATPLVKEDIIRNLGLQSPNVFTSSFNRPNLYYEIRQKSKDPQEVYKDIITFIRKHPGVSGIIYCMSRQTVETFSQVLSANGIKALPYHAGLEQKVRVETQDAFINEDIDVIVATIAFGMGIDKPDVRYVIHYDFPKSMESYYQETGRAGRDGGDGICIAYYSEDDIRKMEKLLQSKKKSNNEREIGRYLLDEVKHYASSPICRRKVLLNYFGEQYDRENCNNCDNCNNQKHRKVEAKNTLVTILKTLKTVKGDFDTDYFLDLLTGKLSSVIQNFKHNDLDEFGILADEERENLETIIQQAVIKGYISKDPEKMGAIAITKAGTNFLKKPVSFLVDCDEDDEDIKDADSAGKGGAGGSGGNVADPTMYNILKDLRKKVARQKDLPPYVIFKDSSLEDMAGSYPMTMDELQKISGVGLSKAKKFGEPFLKVIAEYVHENDIERPEDMRIRTVPSKSKLKVSIVQLIDRKVSLEDIANTYDLDFAELLSEMEAIVNNGTKINISYFIDDVMEADKVDDIYDYFRHSESDDLEKAISALGDCEEEEIRLVRIKFLSELAN